MDQELPTTTNYSAHVLEDSLNAHNQRLTTLVVTFPRIILSEFNTHRALSKNSASSRARPAMKVVKEILESPFLPHKVGRNQSGMSANDYYNDETLSRFHEQLLIQRDRNVLGFFENLLTQELVRKVIGPSNYENYLVNGFQGEWEGSFNALEQTYKTLTKNAPNDQETFFNPHKQTVNRYLEPYMWHTVIVSGTDWGNFYGLREDEANAAPEIYTIAKLMREAMDGSSPIDNPDTLWHTPFLNEEEKTLAVHDTDYWLKVSVGRCARVSYVNHFGERNPQSDCKLAESLLKNGHMSPFEHVALPMDDNNMYGNFRGWKQYRKFIPGENDFSTKH